MIHLIGKLYLTTDQAISKDNNRVVISDTCGYPKLGRNDENHFDLYAGTLIAFAQGQTLPEEYTSWGDMISHLIKVSKAEDKRVYINADTLSATEILTAWFKMLLPEATAGVLHNLMLAYKFKFDLLEGPDINPLVVEDLGEYGSIFNITDAMDIDIDYNDVSIEFLLASYVNDGSYQTELVDKLNILLSKYSINLLIDIKLIYLKQLNLGEIPNKFMTTERIWGNNINLNQITSSDLDKFKSYLIASLPSSVVGGANLDFIAITEAIAWVNASKITKTMLDNVLLGEFNALTNDIDDSIFASQDNAETCNYYLIRDTLNDNTPNIFYG